MRDEFYACVHWFRIIILSQLKWIEENRRKINEFTAVLHPVFIIIEMWITLNVLLINTFYNTQNILSCRIEIQMRCFLLYAWCFVFSLKNNFCKMIHVEFIINEIMWSKINFCFFSLSFCQYVNVFRKWPLHTLKPLI